MTFFLAYPDTADTVYEPSSGTYTLWISAEAPNLLDSPRTMVDEFVGSPDDADVPQWVTREKTWVMFRQKQGRFALLFVSMAVWEYNHWKPELSDSMFKWAEIISSGTGTEFIWTLESWRWNDARVSEEELRSFRKSLGNGSIMGAGVPNLVLSVYDTMQLL
ncbi:hypothetical protein ARMSODRAFT_975930 [Armillaria solidipes]|uniref:Uncharacterized protein n=1 Tax=Armillaria solidipes TaxID=1076256 RepID=A0A2H3BFT8_9AGAR|nr:hypothetical protein ARMSODRAFT_975930 [Armillaria solidipes]